MVYLFITKDKTVEHYVDKEEAQKLFGYGEPDMVITEQQYDEAQGLFRLIDGKIFLGKTDEEKKEDKAVEVRQVRDSYLKQTDVYLLADFPLNKTQKDVIIKYRQELRDLPSAKDFPYIEVPSIPKL